MYCFMILAAFWSVSSAQTTLGISAEGSLLDGSSGVAVGSGVGANVQGTGIVDVDKDSSRSSVVLSATGGTPLSTPKPNLITEVTVVKPAQKAYYHPLPVCEHIKDNCKAIVEYSKCGYCYTQKYPTKGYGCSYTEEVVYKKKGDSKKKDEYETIITPHCHCEGTYIIDAKVCPSCDTLLVELLKCAGIEHTNKLVEVKIPEKCVKAVGVTEKILLECKFLKAATVEKTAVVKKEKAEKPKEYVIVKQQKPETVIVTKPKEYVVVKNPKPVIATATATATATASGSALASADATATAIKGL
eukprot:TRINITY_DN20119_c0_g1_i3.p1 TRINITY_DN20119_c0_g1~~TRINITY_DN20119_c0_g1_i3.p1  ORF type:complete len:334 (+),score=42.69 TRINITY_DN20119_c0_g1_i3:102-1004(+)